MLQAPLLLDSLEHTGTLYIEVINTKHLSFYDENEQSNFELLYASKLYQILPPMQ